MYIGAAFPNGKQFPDVKDFDLFRNGAGHPEIIA
jgi:hypothetical protein